MAVIDWTLTGLIPTDGLLAWHLYDPDSSTSGNIDDASGNGKHLVQASTPPQFTTGVHNGQPGWYFDGSASLPLQSASSASITVKNLFIFAVHEDATFSQQRGLVSGKTSGDLLYGDTGTVFTDTGHDAYLKSAVDMDTTWTAPTGTPELMEIYDSGGVAIDGINVGRRKGDAATKWKGYFLEQMMFDRILDGTERLQVMLYFNIKYAAWAMGVPLYFPSKDLLTTATGVLAYSRFDDMEPDYDKITDTWEYEDGLKDRNEVGPSAPMTWEVGFTIPGSPANMPQVFAYREIFEGFNKIARRANPFYFRDKWGQLWGDVFIKDYSSSHTAHKSWTQEIKFTLESNTDAHLSVAVPEAEFLIEGDDLLMDG